MRGQFVCLRPGIDSSALGFLPVAVREAPQSAQVPLRSGMGPVSRDALGRTPPCAGSLLGSALAAPAGALRRRDRVGDDNGCGKDLPPGSAPEAYSARGRLMPAGLLAGYRGSLRGRQGAARLG